MDLRVRIRLAPNIEFTIGPSYDRYGVRDAQWVDLVENNVNGQIQKHYVYGELESQTLDFTTRADISFTPTLSLQFYLQPFLTVGEYSNFKELVAPKTYQFKPYPLEGKPRLPLPLFARQCRSPLGVSTRKHVVLGVDPIARSRPYSR